MLSEKAGNAQSSNAHVLLAHANGGSVQGLAAAEKAALGMAKESTMENDPKKTVLDRKFIAAGSAQKEMPRYQFGSEAFKNHKGL